jgi:hypothetical protein
MSGRCQFMEVALYFLSWYRKAIHLGVHCGGQFPLCFSFERVVLVDLGQALYLYRLDLNMKK